MKTEKAADLALRRFLKTTVSRWNEVVVREFAVRAATREQPASPSASRDIGQ